MYEALVARIRYHIQKANFMGLKEAESTLLLGEAADAIEELLARLEAYDGCPLVEIPPHGRLVDLDEMRVLLDSEIQAYMHGYKRSAWDFICALRDVLDNAPAIIPSEDEHTMEEFMYGQEGNPHDGSM